jgi:hypothetical protein
LTAKNTRLPNCRSRIVDGHPEANQQGHGDVGVRQQERAVLVQEQGVPDRLGDHETGDDQKQVGEKENAALEFAGPEVEESLNGAQHRVAGPPAASIREFSPLSRRGRLLLRPPRQ